MTPEWERAARMGDVAALRTEIDAGADVDALDRYGQTALMLAARHGHAEAVELLVGAGAALDVVARYSLSALMLAVVNHHDSIARLLARAGADRTLVGSGAPGFAGKTAARLAADRGLEALARDLAPRAGS
jgi:ankyrin repeat protein